LHLAQTTATVTRSRKKEPSNSPALHLLFFLDALVCASVFSFSILLPLSSFILMLLVCVSPSSIFLPFVVGFFVCLFLLLLLLLMLLCSGTCMPSLRRLRFSSDVWCAMHNVSVILKNKRGIVKRLPQQAHWFLFALFFFRALISGKRYLHTRRSYEKAVTDKQTGAPCRNARSTRFPLSAVSFHLSFLRQHNTQNKKHPRAVRLLYSLPLSFRRPMLPAKTLPDPVQVSH
jgi:hypothetical protein